MPDRRYQAVIRHYKMFKAANHDTWRNFTATRPDLGSAIVASALSRDAQGKKHPHQYRLKNSTLFAFCRIILQNISSIRNAQTFHDLYTLLYQMKISGIGALAIYDIAVRIGAFLRLEPQVVYLHAGTRVGVEKLVGKVVGDTISKNRLPTDFRQSNLSCYDLEDLMCIYKIMLR